MIQVLEGDATHIYRTPVIIAHIVNNRAKWGAGFAAAISKKWYRPREDYMDHARRSQQRPELLLGDIRYVMVQEHAWVCSMFAQDGLRSRSSPPGEDYLNYEALEICLQCLYRTGNPGCSVQMPMIGSGLAGGDWDRIYPLIEDYHTMPTYIYTLPAHGR